MATDPKFPTVTRPIAVQVIAEALSNRPVGRQCAIDLLRDALDALKREPAFKNQWRTEHAIERAQARLNLEAAIAALEGK